MVDSLLLLFRNFPKMLKIVECILAFVCLFCTIYCCILYDPYSRIRAAKAARARDSRAWNDAADWRCRSTCCRKRTGGGASFRASLDLATLRVDTARRATDVMSEVIAPYGPSKGP